MSYARGFKARNHPQQDASDDVDDRGTEPALFATFHHRWSFTVDAAAADHNAKLPRYWTLDDDGLSQPWGGERVWCNPPYSNVRPWVEKAWTGSAALVVMLLPSNRTEQRWWQELVEPYRDRSGSPLTTENLPGRLRFLMPGQDRVPANSRPPFGCVLLVWSFVPDRLPLTATQPRLIDAGGVS